MQFNDVIGNDILKRQLVAMVDEGRVGHSIMLLEKGGYGALPLALATIQYLSCTNKSGGDSCGLCHSCRIIGRLIHPDLHFVFPVNVTAKSGSEKKPVSATFMPIWRELVLENPYFTEDALNSALGIEDKVGTISVSEAKEILSKMNMRSYEGGNKYMVIWLPERMTTEAANKLLKIVEEPFPGTYFFFISQSPEKVMETIRSRCLKMQLHPLPVKDSENNSVYLPLITAILNGCLSKDLVTVLNTNDTIVALGREKQKGFCVYCESFIRKLMMISKGLDSLSPLSPEEKAVAYPIARKIPDAFFEKAYDYLESARLSIESNVNAKMVFCNLGNLFFVSL